MTHTDSITSNHADVREVVSHLFRQESGKLASSLTRAFGLSRLGDVEDIVQDTLLAALRVWSFRGIPENPTAWLHRAARNRAIDWIRKGVRETRESAEMLPGMKAAAVTREIEEHFLDWEISDSQLRMMFACCHPDLPLEQQIALTLKTLCGFSVREIANAFLAEESAIEKRLGRARKFFRDRHVTLDAPTGRDLTGRTGAVLSSLYLLFNEGYKRTESDGLLQKDLCLEALRLALLLTEHTATASSEALALVSLMTFHAARFDARTDDDGAIVLLSEQDRTKWNAHLIERGVRYLVRSEPDTHRSHYHLEAAIQALHALAQSYEETDWAAILGLYRRLYELNPSPIVAMHMSVSLGKVHGYGEAIELLERQPVENYYLYHALLGDAFEKSGRPRDAAASYGRAIALTHNAREKALLSTRRDRLALTFKS